MALPAGRYGVTKNQLLKIKKLPMNTIKLIEELTEKYDLLGNAAFKNSTSVVTDSTDLVESGAVYGALVDGEVFYCKNLLPITLDGLKALNTSGIWNGNIYTYNNLVFTVNVDNAGHVASIKVNGSNTSQFNFTLAEFDLAQGNYKLNGFDTDGGYSSFWINVYSITDSGNVADLTINTDTNVNINANKKLRVRLFTAANYTADNLIIKPMLRKATESNPTYEPYYVPLKDVVPNKCDTSVIAPTENGTTVQKSGGYAVGSHAIRNGAFITWKNAKAQGETINDASDYTSGNVASELENVEQKGSSALTNVNANITVNNPCWIQKYGKVVCFAIRFTVSNELSGSYTLFNLPYIPKEQYVFASLYNRTAPFEPITTGTLYIDSAGKVSGSSFSIPAGEYNVTCTFITK